MISICKTIYSVIRDYYGDGIMLAISVAAFLYLFIKDKELRKKLLWPVVLILFIVVNPVLYKYIYVKIVYRRLFWLYPEVLLISAAFVKLVMGLDKAWKKGILSAFMLAIFVFSRDLVFVKADYNITKNTSKLPEEVVSVCDIILESGDEPRCVMASDLYCYVRQYSGEIKQMFGRDVDGFIGGATNLERSVAFMLNQADYSQVLGQASFDDYNYVVVNIEKEIPVDLQQEYGYKEIERTAKHIIYHQETEATGWLMSQQDFGSKHDESFYTFKSSDGRLVVIDGGTNWKKAYKELKAMGGHVDAWILTSYSYRHAMTYLKIATKKKDITIDSVYVPKANLDKIASTTNNKQEKKFIGDLNNMLIGASNVYYIKQGDSFSIDTLNIKVLASDGRGGSALRNASIALAFFSEYEGALILSDVPKNSGKDVFENLGTDIDRIKAVALGNHGYKSLVTRDYERFSALEVAFLDAKYNAGEGNRKTLAIGDILMALGDRGISLYSIDGKTNMVTIR